eukprot:TRINITY_DN8924_c0_g3_i1.p1 TRINITY_DN8924_c0_g3~~TRINITY_DN8924_c0_g3_i1.p1  ORF type:complete len:269 (-),score=39.31 TRINITY_DN8924_c0_g3_i1:331-1137(-)
MSYRLVSPTAARRVANCSASTSQQPPSTTRASPYSLVTSINLHPDAESQDKPTNRPEKRDRNKNRGRGKKRAKEQERYLTSEEADYYTEQLMAEYAAWEAMGHTSPMDFMQCTLDVDTPPDKQTQKAAPTTDGEPDTPLPYRLLDQHDIPPQKADVHKERQQEKPVMPQTETQAKERRKLWLRNGMLVNSVEEDALAQKRGVPDGYFRQTGEGQSDNNSSDRSWNDEFYRFLAISDVNLRYESLYLLCKDFADTASLYGRIIISEMFV